MPRQKTFVVGALVVVCLLYALQLFSPLRLSTDSIIYLTMAGSAADGQGFVAFGRSDIFPHGYPSVLAILVFLGLGASWSFIALNLCCLAIGLFASYRIIREHLDPAMAGIICGLVALSYVSIKYATQPLADFVFFGILMTALLALTRIPRLHGSARIFAIGVAVVATAAAIYVRMIGITLLPALAWALLPGGSIAALRDRMRGRRAIYFVAAGILLAAAAGIVLLARSRYVDELIRNYEYWGPYEAIMYSLRAKIREWAELVINVPFARMPAGVQLVMRPVGAIAMLIALVSLVPIRRQIEALDVFLLSYVGILFLYPAQQPRYWVPILALVLWRVVDAVRRWTPERFARARRLAAATYVLWFGTLGLIALGYSTRITFAGDAFPERYGDGTLTEVYAAAFRGTGEPELLRDRAMQVLIRYEPRVHPRWIALAAGEDDPARTIDVPLLPAGE